jgi:RNA polymerase sigma-70 factor (ECF subfamily)
LNITELWKKNADFVYSVCKRFVREREIAEDIRQDVFLKIINTRKSFKKESDVKTWLYSIAYHCCLDYFREEKRQQDIASEYRFAGDFYVKDIEFPMWNACLPSAMPCPISQFVMELYFIDGLSRREIARIFGISVFQVRKKIRMGLCNLQNFLD